MLQLSSGDAPTAVPIAPLEHGGRVCKRLEPYSDFSSYMYVYTCTIAAMSVDTVLRHGMHHDEGRCGGCDVVVDMARAAQATCRILHKLGRGGRRGSGSQRSRCRECKLAGIILISFGKLSLHPLKSQPQLLPPRAEDASGPVFRTSQV